ncbi:MAG: histidine kinase [Flavobacteriales bacterium]
MRLLFRFVLCISLPAILNLAPLRANQPMADSLFRALKKNTSENATRADILNAVSLYYYSKDFTKSYDYAVKAENLSEKIGYNKGYYRAITNKANALVAFGRPADAIKIYKKILAYDIKINDQVCQAVDYNVLSTAHAHLGMYEQALQYAFKSLRLYEKLGDATNQILNLNVIAGHYYTLNKYTQAKKYVYTALELLHDHPHAVLQAYCYAFLAACFEIDHQFDSTAIYLNKARAIYEKQQDFPGIITTHNNLCELMLQLQRIDSAFVHAQQAVVHAKKMGWSAYISHSYRKVADCYLHKNASKLGSPTFNYKMSLAYLDSSQIYVSRGTEDQLLLYQMRSDAHKAMGYYDSALVWYEKFKSLSDSVYHSQQDKNIEELNVRYQVEKKEQLNKTLKQKNKIQTLELERGRYLLYGISVLVIVIIAISLLLIRQNRIKAQQRTLLAEQKLLRSQMNPHFIFNSLTSIESYIYANQPKEAGRYLSDFARLMRLILENSREEEISLDSEIQTLEYYLTMQKLRMEDRLNWSVKTENIPDLTEILIPPMLTQPFIENAIEHGIGSINQPGKVDVLFSIQGHVLYIDVTDNGIGFHRKGETPGLAKKHKSLALEITRERLENYNRNRKNKTTLIITDLSAENPALTGTHVRFTIPLT